MMNVVIVEDESIAARRLTKRLKQIRPDVEIIAVLSSVKESVAWFQSDNHDEADLIFLDIQLSDGLSFSIFDEISLNTPIIFTTAYDEYAVRAFELNSVAYLMKPVRSRDLEESLNKLDRLKSAFTVDFERLLNEIQGNEPEFRERFLIQIGEKFITLKADRISYFYTFQKSVYVRSRKGRSYPIDLSLDALQGSLDPAVFFRINRQIIVHIDAIEEMMALSRSRMELTMCSQHDDDIGAIVSAERSADFRKWLGS